MKNKPLVDRDSLLEKFPGKGGWTYTLIPEVWQDKSTPFGWVKVRGAIDTYQLEQYKLMPMGDGKHLFLPVKAAIRKQIKKEAGDIVHVLLYEDSSTLVIPDEIISCLKDDSTESHTKFMAYSEGEQKAFVDWINSAKTEETKAKRIIEMLDKIKINKGFYSR